MESKRWSNRDWFWLVGILLVIIIFLVAKVFDYVNIEANFSIISSAVSIALALVAIFIALKQDSDNQQVNSRVSYLLNEISANVRNVDAKVDKIDPRLVNSVTEEVVEEYSQGSKEKESFTKEEVDEIVSKVSNDIASNINVILNKEDKKNIIHPVSIHGLDKRKKMRIHRFIELNPHLSPVQIQIIIHDDYNILLKLSDIKEMLERIKNPINSQ